MAVFWQGPQFFWMRGPTDLSMTLSQLKTFTLVLSPKSHVPRSWRLGLQLVIWNLSPHGWRSPWAWVSGETFGGQPETPETRSHENNTFQRRKGMNTNCTCIAILSLMLVVVISLTWSLPSEDSHVLHWSPGCEQNLGLCTGHSLLVPYAWKCLNFVQRHTGSVLSAVT